MNTGKYILLLSTFWVSISFSARAQPPEGYYGSTQGLYEDELRNALHQIIDNHDVQSYSSLWDHFEETDAREDGSVWDMYSDVPGGTPPYTYQFSSDQCGNYDGEGDCFNREHSLPSSWYDDQSPMDSDLFHVYPTDGFVNGIRGNLPYADVGAADEVTQNGSRRGQASVSGFSGNAFEPIDEYKGDVARSYFYMMCRYKDEVQSWNSSMLQGNDLADWSAQMLLEWHQLDPVSQKEEDRNNAVYQIQGNRNPFIDQPFFAERIYSETASVAPVDQIQIEFWIEGNTIRVTGHQGNVDQVYVYSTTGAVIEARSNSTGNIQLQNVPESPAIYFVRIIEEGQLFTGKLFLR